MIQRGNAMVLDVFVLLETGDVVTEELHRDGVVIIRHLEESVTHFQCREEESGMGCEQSELEAVQVLVVDDVVVARPDRDGGIFVATASITVTVGWQGISGDPDSFTTRIRRTVQIEAVLRPLAHLEEVRAIGRIVEEGEHLQFHRLSIRRPGDADVDARGVVCAVLLGAEWKFGDVSIPELFVEEEGSDDRLDLTTRETVTEGLVIDFEVGWEESQRVGSQLVPACFVIPANLTRRFVLVLVAEEDFVNRTISVFGKAIALPWL